jgi:[ribosomal protein S5]-alanine N-acetyltransferase
MATTRLLALDDAPAFTDLVLRNRDFKAPWDPVYDEDHFTVRGQLAFLGGLIQRQQEGSGFPLVILNDVGDPVGLLRLNGIVRGFFQSCSLGYWVDQVHNGRGLATAAVGEAVALAFGELGLHRVQAETLLHNAPSQRVLERNGFVRFGLAPAYLNIAGRWQDHLLYQRLNDAG